MKIWSTWEQLHHSTFTLQQRKEHQFVSVIVIGRNEKSSIKECLSSIANNNYPNDKFEIIFVDDHSEDGTAQIATELNIPNLNVLHLSDYLESHDTKSFKKLGMRYALKHAKGSIIACTDADCVVPKNWISYIDFGMQQALIKMLVMPICFEQEKSIINRFQSLDLMATMAFSGYGIQSKQFYAANGANMAFRKSIYNQMDIQERYASGDDMFLVQEVTVQFPEGIKYLKSTEALVKTAAESRWTHLYHQRKRWATKSKAYTDRNLVNTQRNIFLYNLLIVINLALGLSFNSLFLFIALIQLLIKGIMDYLLLMNMSEFFEQRKALKFFLISFLVFTPYILLMGLFATLGKQYLWKGRRVS